MKTFSNMLPPGPLAAGFVYWLLFLLALEPGNIVNAGGQLVLEQEIFRIVGASILGACSAPLVLAMVRRYPIDEKTVWRSVALQLAGCIAIATTLVAVSCVLAVWGLASEHRSLLVALPQELEGNGLLVTFGTAGFAALSQTRFLRPRGANVSERAVTTALASVSVKARGREHVINLSDVDWIEAQGNYLALHCGSNTHLLRMGLAALEAKLDPRRFARVHRGAIVAVARVCEIRPLGAGDASLHLADGAELRLSRTYRAGFMAARESLGTELPQNTSLEVAPLQSYNS